MSRIGKLPINIPAQVNIGVTGNDVKITGPKGELSLEIKDFVSLNQENSQLSVAIKNENDKFQKGVWGLTRTLLGNMITGVTTGFEKSLEINGVGYKFEVVGTNKLILSVGFSHKVELITPKGISLSADEKAKNMIYIKGIDKQQVGFFAAKIRAVKKPEPYKGKGIKYTGEYIRRKAGKTGGKK
ncbi:50S ribosomal protein L6 [Candidatus Gracilibacteria bacterium]|nr:50S ribosomal protein L6 [Candidatus Gracilibacteria bacterium]